MLFLRLQADFIDVLLTNAQLSRSAAELFRTTEPSVLLSVFIRGKAFVNLLYPRSSCA
jgi:hypothetical protein